MSAGKRVGVLALQGDFEAHKKALEQAGAKAIEVRTAAELDAVDALVLPGGESTTMLKLLDEEQLFEPLQRFGRERPIFGTCAGAILLATGVLKPEQRSLGLVDITVERNGYGRQLESRIVRLPWDGDTLEAVFIRAPIIHRTGPGVNILASWRDTPVLIEQGRHLVATFHPELSDSTLVHELFVRRLHP